MQDDAVINCNMNGKQEKNKIKRIKQCGLYAANEGRSAVDIRIPQGQCALCQRIKTKIPPIKELMPRIGVLIT